MNLITGATGLIGSHVAYRLLIEEKPVFAIKQSTSDINKTKKLFSYYTADYENLFKKIKWIEADISDIYSLIDVLEGIEVVYHCAGFVSFDKKDIKRLYKINDEGTANIVNACLEKRIKMLCHVSSIATLQNPDITKNIDESVYWKFSPNASDYAISKYNGEREVWRGMEEGLNAVIVNPSIIIGPGNWNKGSTAIFKNIYRQFPWYSTGTTGFVDVRDVADAMVALMKSNISAERFILSGHNESYQNLFNCIADTFHKKRPSKKVTPFLARIVAFLESIKSGITGKEALITRETAATAMAHVKFDNSKLKQFLPGFNYRSLEETVQYTCNELLKQHLR